jgi:hypothetical protein
MKPTIKPATSTAVRITKHYDDGPRFDEYAKS